MPKTYWGESEENIIFMLSLKNEKMLKSAEIISKSIHKRQSGHSNCRQGTGGGTVNSSLKITF
jgi:hypothetical protein